MSQESSRQEDSASPITLKAEDDVDVDIEDVHPFVAAMPIVPAGQILMAHPYLGEGALKAPVYTPVKPLTCKPTDDEKMLVSLARELIRRAWYLRYPAEVRQAWLGRGILGQALIFEGEPPASTPMEAIGCFIDRAERAARGNPAAKQRAAALKAAIPRELAFLREAAAGAAAPAQAATHAASAVQGTSRKPGGVVGQMAPHPGRAPRAAKPRASTPQASA